MLLLRDVVLLISGTRCTVLKTVGRGAGLRKLLLDSTLRCQATVCALVYLPSRRRSVTRLVLSCKLHIH